MIKIIEYNDITPDEIINKKKQGYNICATPHLGNIHRYGLAMSKTEADIVLVDVNVPIKDDIAYPADIILNNNHYKVASNQCEISSPYLYVTDDYKISYLSKGDNLSSIHYHKLKKIVDKTFITSDYFYLKDQRIIEILEILIKHDISCFNRFLDETGKMIKMIINGNNKNINKFLDVCENKKDIVVDKKDVYIKEGPITSRDVNLAMMIFKSLFDTIDNGIKFNDTGEIYVYSGKTMIKYIKQKDILEFLNKVYKLIYDTKKFNIPRDLNVKMMNGYIFRNMPTVNEIDRIEIMNKVAEVVLENEEVSKKLRSENDIQKKQSLIELSKQNTIKRTNLKEEYKKLSKDVKRITQYDDNDIIIPDLVKKLTLTQIDKLFN